MQVTGWWHTSISAVSMSVSKRLVYNMTRNRQFNLFVSLESTSKVKERANFTLGFYLCSFLLLCGQASYCEHDILRPGAKSIRDNWNFSFLPDVLFLRMDDYAAAVKIARLVPHSPQSANNVCAENERKSLEQKCGSSYWFSALHRYDTLIKSFPLNG